ncbi:MAG: 2,3-bisphosphoglycerate-independent phosphoglycerate mutase [Myxococcales bacterium]|nr:2,3-bisphosphoglycerate-independent phosphoglycerate mutase [Myxococcales bacterium]
MTDWNLRKSKRFAGVPGPVLICVMDGVGAGNRDEGDAVFLARTPTLDRLAANCPSTHLAAHGTAVGMPSDADMGNSEVGHNALGAGRTFDQGAKLVDHAIRSGAMFEGEAWKAVCGGARGANGTVHFVGLLSDGNVHSHIDHLIAMLERCHAQGVGRVRVHALIDGRDVPETSALEYVQQLEAVLARIREQPGRDYRVASGGGRMTTTMDRYGADWTMVERGYELLVHGRGRGFPSLSTAIETLRNEQPGVIDQNLPGFVIVDGEGQPVGPVRDGDAVVLFNFRGDRALQMTQAFEQDAFPYFDRGERPDALFVGMMQYDGDLHLPARFLVEPPAIDQTLGEYLVRNGERQLAISETQKFGHVTYFWNGNRSGAFDTALETYIEIPSDTLPFEERPWMKAAEITDALIAQLRDGSVRHGRLNYANGDMVGHTGHREAAIAAVQAVDLQIARLLPVVAMLQGALIVTADHGNADEMYELDKKTGAFAVDEHSRPRAKTSHTLNRVPFYVYAPGVKLQLDDQVRSPGLANVAATALQLMGYQPPADYAPGMLAL